MAYDTPVPGYGTYNTNNMRLWASKPSHEFDLASFNAGDYYGAVEAKVGAVQVDFWLKALGSSAI